MAAHTCQRQEKGGKGCNQGWEERTTKTRRGKGSGGMQDRACAERGKGACPTPNGGWEAPSPRRGKRHEFVEDGKKTPCHQKKRGGRKPIRRMVVSWGGSTTKEKGTFSCFKKKNAGGRRGTEELSPQERMNRGKERPMGEERPP